MFPGFSSNMSFSNYRVEDEKRKLAIEEMNGYDMYKDIDRAFAERRGVPYTDICGLPSGASTLEQDHGQQMYRAAAR
jgi:salicylate hydroxylase